MENINIKVILDEVFGKLCNTSNNITCDTCKYKEDCNLINKFTNDIKDKGLSPDQYVRSVALFVCVLKEQKYINDFGKTQEDIIKLVTKDGFELDWLINRWNSIIEDKDILKPIIAVFPKYAKDMIIKIVEANTKINHFIAQHIIDTSNAEYKEIIKMANQSVDNNKQENKFKNVSDDEIYAEIKRRKANKSAK
jgi:dTDP-D-glucose 4,6-dehydratase